MLKIFISKEIDLDSKELSVIAALNGLYSNKQDYLITSVSGIGYFISGSFLNKSVKRDRRIADNIKGALQSLNDRKIIEIAEQDGDNYIISNNGLEVDTENQKFVVVELWEMQHIFTYAKMPFNLFVYCLRLSILPWQVLQREEAVINQQRFMLSVLIMTKQGISSLQVLM